MAIKQILKSKKTAPVKKVAKTISKSNAPAKKVTPQAKKSSAPAKKITAPVKKQSAPVKKVAAPAKKPSTPVKKAVVPAKKPSAPVKKVIVPVKKPSTSPVKKVVLPVKKVIPPVKKIANGVTKKVETVKKVVAPVKKQSAPIINNSTPVKTVSAPVKKGKAVVEKPKIIIRTEPIHPINQQNNTPKKAYTGPKKLKYQTEIEIHASPKILYPYLSTASGLAEWFANKVNEANGVFTFTWEESQKFARLVSKRENQSVKFHWIDDPDETFFEIEIIQDDLTSDVALLITDFCLPGEKEEECSLWESQIHDLMHVVGS